MKKVYVHPDHVPVYLKQGTRVRVKDGDGVTVGMDFRAHSGGGKGTRQYVVQLDDGRKRRYGVHAVSTL